MGLSNYLPSSRLIQPGVIANSGERPASPYEGQVVYQKDTNQTLVWDGSAWVMVHDLDAPPGMQLVASASFTGASSFEITGFTTGFSYYKVVADIRRTNTGGSNVSIRYANGSTERNSAYHGAYWRAQYNGTTQIVNFNNSAEARICTANDQCPSFVTFDIYGIDGSTSAQASVMGQSMNRNDLDMWTFGYTKTVADVNDRIKVIASSDSMYGKWRLYGYRD